jgi:hypothetical protein
MFQTFGVELKPTATGNGYRNKWIVMFKRECIIVVCEAYAVHNLLVNEQKVIVSIIIVIITGLLVLH